MIQVIYFASGMLTHIKLGLTLISTLVAQPSVQIALGGTLHTHVHRCHVL